MRALLSARAAVVARTRDLFRAEGFFLAAPAMGAVRHNLLGLCCLLSIPSCCRALQTKSLLSAVFERRVAHTEIMRMLAAGA